MKELGVMGLEKREPQPKGGRDGDGREEPRMLDQEREERRDRRLRSGRGKDASHGGQRTSQDGIRQGPFGGTPGLPHTTNQLGLPHVEREGLGKSADCVNV